MLKKWGIGHGRERVAQHLPLSPNEERYILAELLTAPIYAIPWALHLRGTLDTRRLADALHEVCNRHEMLRAGFERGEDGRFTRYVEATARVDLQTRDLFGAPPNQIGSILHDFFFQKPDFTPQSLKHFLVIRTGDDEYIFGLNLHHSISDGQSSRLFIEEVFACYRGESDGAVPKPFSAFWLDDWRGTPAYADAVDFWKGALSNVDEVAALPDDRAEAEGHWGAGVRTKLPPELVDATTDAAKACGVTLFTLFYGAAVLALSRLADHPMVCTTFQSNGRRRTGDMAGTIGSFSNGLVLATEVDEQRRTREFLQRMNTDIRTAIAHEDCPYHHVIQETGVHPRFGVNWFPRLRPIAIPGLEITDHDLSDRQDDYDLNLRFVQRPDNVELIVFYRDAGISRARAQAAAHQVFAIAAAFARDLDAPLAASRPAAEPDFDGPLEAAGGELVHAAFLAQAKANPAAIAIEHEGRIFSYGEVEARSRALAAHLQSKGIGPGDRVAVIADRQPALIWTALAVLRTGGVLAILDSAYPDQRLETLIDLCRPAMLIGNSLDPSFAVAERLADAWSIPLVSADAEHSPVDGYADPAIRPADPAYFLFTSGSTGVPKCVACSHMPLAHFVRWQGDTFALSSTDRFTMLSGLSHDPLMRDVFTPLSIGAAILIPPQEALSEPGRLGAWMVATRPTVAHMTPPLGQILLSARQGPPIDSLTHVFWGGDILRPVLLEAVSRLAPHAGHINFYGATETPQAIGFCRYDGDTGRKSVPIGKAVPGFKLAVVDRDLRPKAVGEVGEIAVRSNYLSLGYVQDGKIRPGFEEKGVADEKIYRTGDKGFLLPDGDIAIIGRKDDQIKIRGYRLDLSEITATLLRHPSVSDASAVAFGPEDNVRVAAFVVDDLDDAERRRALLAYLAERLPNYMIPSVLEGLPALPLLPNGKVDRRSLQQRAAAYAPPPEPLHAGPAANATEAALIDLWSDLLRGSGVSPASTFVELGGDSLSYVQVYMGTEEIVGQLPAEWTHLPIRDIAQLSKKGRSLWSWADSTMVARAVSIVLVVAGHFKTGPALSGATNALLMVSGFLFGSFQLKEVFARQDPKPIIDLFWKLLLPVALISYLLFAKKYVAGVDPSFAMLTFTENFIEYSREGYDRHELFLWFVHCMLQMILFIYAALSVLKWSGKMQIGLFRFCVILFLIGCVGRFVLPALFVDNFFTTGIRSDQHIWLYAPSANLATFALGALIASADERRVKDLLLPLVCVFSIFTWMHYTGGGWAFALGMGCALLYLRRIPVPRLLLKPVYIIAGSSLFIYLLHYQAHGLAALIGLGDWPIAQVALAVALGIAMAQIWQKVELRLARARRRQLGKEQVIL